MKKIEWIGVDIMGKPMARNLTKADFELRIYARTKAKVEDVIHEGVTFHEAIQDCVEGCEAVITMVGFLRDVEEVYFAENDILGSAGAGAYLVGMMTTNPALVKRLSEAGAARGYHIIDAPATGDDRGARSGTLSIMIGGGQKDYEVCLPLLQAIGENIRYYGKAGYGQHAKLANQIIIAGTPSGVREALAHAKAQGLDLQTVFDSVSTGSAVSRQLNFPVPKMMDGDYAPGFFLKHFVKDMKPALEEAGTVGLDLAVLRQTLSNSKELGDAGYGDLGAQTLIKYYEQ